MTSLSKNVRKVVAGLVKPLSDRNRDIVLRRFGLKNGGRETLESIGQSYGITRERVRQIEEYALKNLRAGLAGSSAAAVRPYFDFASETLADHGGFILEKSLFEKFSSQSKDNQENFSLVFLLSLDSSFQRNYENDDLRTFWFLNNGSSDTASGLTQTLVDSLKSKKALQTQEELYDLYKTLAKTKPIALTALNVFTAALAISKKIDRNVFGEYGLAEWSDVRPRGMKDRAYLVMKKAGKPKHFREIAGLINTAQFSVKKANVQTVHNELIKDIRFVLVGRGIYGLTEWGYKSGTVKDVLIDILKESRRPLAKTELVSRVLSSRQVKENTILLNLQDSKIFSRREDGTYALREA